MPGESVEELLREYQGYVLAYRLRAAIGGKLTPPAPLLSLSTYAVRRLERQELARSLVRRGADAAQMRRLDDLSGELLFGFWLNPAEMAAFLRAAIREGGHPALGSAPAFAALLTPGERARLGPQGVQRVCQHHLACFTLAVPMLDPDALQVFWQRIEDTTPPVFIDGLVEQ